jgi:outer membrane protein assembly factor BamE (lipoprotein component of BamABCDE complex)
MTMTMMKPILIGPFLGAALLGAACSSTKAPSVPSFPARTFTAPWSMSAGDIERFRTSVNSVNLGDTMTHVVETVGAPDSDQTFQKNKRHRIFTYYITRQQAEDPIASDKVVMISFDVRDKVEGLYSNVENIATRNWPGE